MLDIGYLIALLTISVVLFTIYGLVEYIKFKKWLSGINEAQPYEEQMHNFSKRKVDRYNRCMKQIAHELRANYQIKAKN